jgi:hypothetical protein
MMKASSLEMLIRLLPFDVPAVQVPSFQIGMSLVGQILQCVRGWKQIVVWLLGRSFVLMWCISIRRKDVKYRFRYKISYYSVGLDGD